MKTIELVKCEDYVLSFEDSEVLLSARPQIKMIQYARLLKQPLTLGMFVPCDEDGNLTREPNAEFCRSTYDCSYYNYDWKRPYEKAKQQYEQALDRVIFEGFEVEDSWSNQTIVGNNTHLIYLRPFIRIERIGPVKDEKIIQTISDLCGYGLKIKVK